MRTKPPSMLGLYDGRTIVGGANYTAPSFGAITAKMGNGFAVVGGIITPQFSGPMIVNLSFELQSAAIGSFGTVDLLLNAGVIARVTCVVALNTVAAQATQTLGAVVKPGDALSLRYYHSENGIGRGMAGHIVLQEVQRG